MAYVEASSLKWDVHKAFIVAVLSRFDSVTTVEPPAWPIFLVSAVNSEPEDLSTHASNVGAPVLKLPSFRVMDKSPVVASYAQDAAALVVVAAAYERRHNVPRRVI